MRTIDTGCINKPSLLGATGASSPEKPWEPVKYMSLSHNTRGQGLGCSDTHSPQSLMKGGTRVTSLVLLVCMHGKSPTAKQSPQAKKCKPYLAAGWVCDGLVQLGAYRSAVTICHMPAEPRAKPPFSLPAPSITSSPIFQHLDFVDSVSCFSVLHLLPSTVHTEVLMTYSFNSI